MTTLNVQFADSTSAVITAYLDSPQDPATWPNQGQIETTDPRWKTFYDAGLCINAGMPAPE